MEISIENNKHKNITNVICIIKELLIIKSTKRLIEYTL